MLQTGTRVRPMPTRGSTSAARAARIAAAVPAAERRSGCSRCSTRPGVLRDVRRGRAAQPGLQPVEEVSRSPGPTTASTRSAAARAVRCHQHAHAGQRAGTPTGQSHEAVVRLDAGDRLFGAAAHVQVERRRTRGRAGRCRWMRRRWRPRSGGRGRTRGSPDVAGVVPELPGSGPAWAPAGSIAHGPVRCARLLGREDLHGQDAVGGAVRAERPSRPSRPRSGASTVTPSQSTRLCG